MEYCYAIVTLWLNNPINRLHFFICHKVVNVMYIAQV